jgi:hypothetical protein
MRFLSKVREVLWVVGYGLYAHRILVRTSTCYADNHRGGGQWTAAQSRGRAHRTTVN